MIVDLFAGPGGWSEGLRMLGHSELGIEWDDAACKTARAAGHRRLKADVAELDPKAYGPFVDGLIASPPCQAWSMAGKGGGRRDVVHVIACALELAAGNDTRAEHAARCEDARSMLVVEPLRWALALQPTWIALEQVPPVLELWTLFAQILEQHGWNCWAGVLEAERYGVPQTRERAILMGHRERVVHPPVATHQRYVPGQPQRHDITLEGEVLPWVSMAEALDWEEGERPTPAPTVTGGGTEAGGVEVFASKGARARVANAVVMRANKQPNAAVRPVETPAPTITGGHDTANRVWMTERPAPTVVGTRRSKDGMLIGRQMAEGQGENIGGRNWQPTHLDQRQTGARPRPVEEPAPAMQSSGLAKGRDRWTEGDGQGRYRKDDAGHITNAVRVTVQEASVLQSFRADYPWQGSRSKQFQQVGNAVPPLLAAAVLSVLIEAQEGRLAA